MGVDLFRLRGTGFVAFFFAWPAESFSSLLLQELSFFNHFCRVTDFLSFFQGRLSSLWRSLPIFRSLARPFIPSLAEIVNSFSSPLPVGKGGYRGNGEKSGQGVIFLVLRTSPLNALCRQRGAYGQAAFFFAAFMGGIAQNSNSPRLAPRGVTI